MYKNLIVEDYSMRKYSRDEIDCFEKPFGLVLDYYSPNNSNYFYMFRKLIDSYRFKNNFRDKTDEFIKKNLGLECFYYDVNTVDNVEEIIISNINREIPVLVSGNVRELFYSPFYKENDHEHTFLISGYDDYKEIYKMLDSDDSVGIKYKTYIIEFTTIRKVYAASNDKMIVIVKKGKNKRKNDFDLLNLLIDIYLSSNPFPFNEQKLIMNIEKNLSSPYYDFTDHLNNLVNLPKHRNVFFLELYDRIISYNIDEDLKIQLHELTELYLKNNKVNVNKIIKSFVMRNKKDFSDYYAFIVQKEKEMRELVLKCKQALQEIESSRTKNREENNFSGNSNSSFEYNEDNIISIKNNIVSFDFHTKRIYSNWDDEHNCPKYIYKANVSDLTDFYFSTKVTVEDDFEEVGFLAGIILTCTNGERYMFGLNSGITLTLEEGIASHLVDIPFSFLSAELSFNYSNNFCEIFYKAEKDKISIMKAPMSEPILSISLACKTWVNGEKLRVNFSDINFV